MHHREGICHDHHHHPQRRNRRSIRPRPVRLAGGSALADGSTVKPTKDQKAAIVKAWSKADGGTAYSVRQCIRVDLSATNKNRAGLRSNGQKVRLQRLCVDGSAILYGHKRRSGSCWPRAPRSARPSARR